MEIIDANYNNERKNINKVNKKRVRFVDDYSVNDYSENDYYYSPKIDYYNMKHKKYNQNFTIFQEEEYKEYENFEDVTDEDYSLNKNINNTRFVFPFICVLSLSPILYYFYKIKK